MDIRDFPEGSAWIRSYRICEQILDTCHIDLGAAYGTPKTFCDFVRVYVPTALIAMTLGGLVWAGFAVAPGVTAELKDPYEAHMWLMLLGLVVAVLVGAGAAVVALSFAVVKAIDEYRSENRALWLYSRGMKWLGIGLLFAIAGTVYAVVMVVCAPFKLAGKTYRTLRGTPASTPKSPSFLKVAWQAIYGWAHGICFVVNVVPATN